ncbi:MAG: YndJ family protein [Chloroflexi bacterium]|nr:YndJ family protein [Chloroflexota bacterium]
MKSQGDSFKGWGANVIFGGTAWLGVGVLSLSGVIEVGLLEVLLLLAPLVTTPLGLALIEIPQQAAGQQRLYQLIKIAQPFGAALVVLAFWGPQGLPAGALAAGWLGVTALIALLGLIRFLSKGFRDLLEIGLDAGLAYLAVGGGWLVLSRLGLNPLGFGDLIVLLTAVHFHYAGFAAPIISSRIGYLLTSFPLTTRRVHRISLIGVIVGMLLVAAGITFSPLLELIGAVEFATSLAILAYLMITYASKVIGDRPARILLTVSAICLIIGMVLTYAYAISEFTGYYLVVIPQMVRFHGVSNALGFVLCGLLACHLGLTRVNSTLE